MPVRTDDQQRDRPHRLRDELQQLQRRLVGPLQVIEHEQYRTAAGEPLQETGYGVEQAKPRCPGVPWTTGIDRGRRVDQLREQPSQLRGIGPDQLGDVIVIQGGQQRAQRYAPRPKRRCALGFSTCSPAEGQPTARGRDADQRGLTHPRLAADQHQTRVAACGVLDRGQQPRQRPITADEKHTSDCARHHMRRPASTSATAGRIPAAATPFPAPSGSCVSHRP